MDGCNYFYDVSTRPHYDGSAMNYFCRGVSDDDPGLSFLFRESMVSVIIDCVWQKNIMASEKQNILMTVFGEIA
jgi:hypothetical protein